MALNPSGAAWLKLKAVSPAVGGLIDSDGMWTQADFQVCTCEYPLTIESLPGSVEKERAQPATLETLARTLPRNVE